MIVVKLIGGLGNQMFQYAAAKALALEKKEKLYIDIRAFKNYDLHAYSLHHFNIREKEYKQQPRWCRKIQNKLKRVTSYNETSFRFNAKIFEIETKHVFLNGYFQSEAYFLKYRDRLLEDFKITSELKLETKALLKDMSGTNAISIHIRRGDFLQHHVHNTSKEDYYKAAMQYIENKIQSPTYYVFSDDMEWVKKNFKTNYKAIYVDFNDAATGFEDLKLMSHCQHNIIANSSFSWWSAWLNTNPNKIVIAPEHWFNGDQYDYTDVVPKSWIKI